MKGIDLGLVAKVLVDWGHQAPTDKYGFIRMNDFQEILVLTSP